MNWDKDSVARLRIEDVRQLRANALARGAHDVVALCDEVLVANPARKSTRKAKRQHELDGRPLVSNVKAFAMRGVTLRNVRWSWGGIRPTDGVVVFSVWAVDIERIGEDHRYLLWGPNADGSRPWADKIGGRERLAHCQRAFESGAEAEGILIYGQQRGADLPADQPSKVSGADPHTVLRFKVVREGQEFWAIWPARQPKI